MSCNCCWFIQPDSAISRNRNGSRDFLMRKVTLSWHCTAVLSVIPCRSMQIDADRFSGHYEVSGTVCTFCGCEAKRMDKSTVTPSPYAVSYQRAHQIQPYFPDCPRVGRPKSFAVVS